MRYVALMTMLILSVNLTLSGQVTIGVDEVPEKGAILQLKDQKNVTGGGANATKGMMLPRVWLTDLNSLVDIDPEAENRPDPLLHTGLIVYNMHDNACDPQQPLRKGVYVWDSQSWKRMTELYSSNVMFFEDQDGNEFRARTFGEAGTWMIENLRATKLADNLGGTPLAESASGTAASFFAYTYPALNKNYFEANPSIGLLYDWDAATNNREFDVSELEIVNGVEKSKHHEGVYLQGICPEGWHIPSVAEWIELEKEIIKNPSLYSLAEILTEPYGGLDPSDPFDGGVGTGGVIELINDRGTHGMAMTNKCNPPGLTTENISKGNSILDGGFSVMMTGCVWGRLSVNHNYGKEAYFHTGSLVDYNTTVYSFVGWSIYPGTDDNVGVSARTPSATDNGGYLSVRCKKN